MTNCGIAKSNRTNKETLELVPRLCKELDGRLKKNTMIDVRKSL